jgi:hypothetical protein
MTTHRLTQEQERHLLDADREFQVRLTKVGELMAADPKLPFVSALTLAGDMLSADRSLTWLREGKYDFGACAAFCGSYGRLDFVVRALEEGLITEDEALKDLPSNWSGSDPDDTDPRFLSLWLTASKRNKYKTLRDKPNRLPSGNVLTVYRGQDLVADIRTPQSIGIAWSLDVDIARKFARGAATRQWDRGGVVYAAEVRRIDIIAYMTGRNEKEVIIDPRDLIDIRLLR